MAKTPTWQRAAGKNPEGGLNEAGRRSLRAAGHDIKRPQPEGGSRKKSFCARMKGMKAHNTSAETANDPDSRINKSLRKWKCADGGEVVVDNALRMARNMGGGTLYNQLNYALNSPTPANPPQDPGPQQPYYQSLPQTRDIIQQYGTPAPGAPTSSAVRQPMPYAGGGEVGLRDLGGSRRLSTMERLGLAAQEYFGPKQEWQTLRDQIRESGMLTPNPKGQPYTEALSNLKTMMGYPAIGQPFTYHRLNDLPLGKGTWAPAAESKGGMEYTPASYKPMPDKFPISPSDADKIDAYTRHSMEGATSWRQRGDPTEMPTTPRQAMNIPQRKTTPAASTRFMEMSIPAQAKLQSKFLPEKALSQITDTGITGRQFVPGVNSDQIVASDAIIPAAHTPSSAQIPWEQTHYDYAHKVDPQHFPTLPQRELTSAGSTSMRGHIWGTQQIDPSIKDPNAERAQSRAEVDRILQSMKQKEEAPQVMGPASLPGGGVGKDVDTNIQFPRMAKGGKAIWNKPRPKSLGKSEPLSPAQKASAKAMAKAAGRPWPNMVDNIRAARKADGGQVEGDVQFAPSDLPMMARQPDVEIENALRMARSAEPVKYDTGPQQGEAVMRPYEPTIKERIYQAVAGTEQRPSPERAGFARGISQMAEFTPVLGNVMAGQEAYRRGDTKGMLMAALPVPGAATEARVAQAAAAPAEQAMREAYQRALNSTGLYSHAAEAAYNLPQAKGSYEQMIAMLQKAGVKPEEIYWSGVEKAFKGQPRVTREQLVQHFEQNVPKIEEFTLGHNREFEQIKQRQQELNDIFNSLPMSKPKYEQYTIPGGENYREVVLHLPSGYEPKIEEKYGRFGFVGPDGKFRDYWTRSDAEQAARSFRRESGDFTSQHWDQPNVLSHLRMSDRTGPEGEKVFHLEELQSDWGQAGRKEGFEQQHPEFFVKNKRSGFSSDAFKTREEAETYQNRLPESLRPSTVIIEQTKKTEGLPPAPYVASPEGKHTLSWVDLGLKRALKEAAEGGYDKLIWTPGEEQAARYDLSKQVRSIDWNEYETDRYPGVNKIVQIEPIEGNTIELPVDSKGRVAENVGTQFDGKPLDEVIGKDLANKILNDRDGSLSGSGLQIGGEGMKKFYDKIVPSQLQKIVKKLDKDAKVQLGGYQLTKERQNAPVNAHVIQITPKMREAILKGFAAYADGGEVVN